MATSIFDAHLFNGFIQIQWPLNLGTAVHLSIDLFLVVVVVFFFVFVFCFLFFVVFCFMKCRTPSSIGLLSRTSRTFVK